MIKKGLKDFRSQELQILSTSDLKNFRSQELQISRIQEKQENLVKVEEERKKKLTLRALALRAKNG